MSELNWDRSMSGYGYYDDGTPILSKWEEDEMIDELQDKINELEDDVKDRENEMFKLCEAIACARDSLREGDIDGARAELSWINDDYVDKWDLDIEVGEP